MAAFAAYWPINPGGNGTTLQDISGNNYNVTLPSSYSNANFTSTGAPITTSTTNAAEYRYGFNGKENDKDISDGGQDYGMRIYDARLGKFLSVDPLTKDYPYYTPYQFCGNNPIRFIDLDGGEPTSHPDFLKNVRLVHDIDKGNIIEGNFQPNDRIEIMQVSRIYDEKKKQAFFVHQNTRGENFYWKSEENTLRIHRKADGTSEANGNWEL